jgi:hypothetical protein
MTRRSAADPRQLLLSGLFEYPKAPEENPGSLNFALELRGVLSNALKKCTPSRYEVAARMSELLGIEVTKYQLDSWTAESRSDWRFPFEYAAAFEVATGTTELQDLLARKRGSRVLVGEEVLKAELGSLELKEAQIRDRKRLLKKHLEGKR